MTPGSAERFSRNVLVIMLKVMFLTLAGMFGLNLIDFVSLTKLKKFILRFYTDSINAMNSFTISDPMFPLYVPSAEGRKLSPFLIYFMSVFTQVTFGFKRPY